MRLGIIGGGAAGIFGAIAAATANHSAEVVVFEATDRPLDKVRISGGGRCNVTHHCFDPAELVGNYPRGHKELRGPFSRFQPRDTVAWFKAHGVELKVEPDGRMFPITDSSRTIIRCLLDTAAAVGADLRLNAGVKAVTRDSDGFSIEPHGGRTERFDRVLLATGSSPQGYRFAEALGHAIVPCVPSLFTFKVDDPRLAELAGVAFERIDLTLLGEGRQKLHQSGPMLITHWGLSGPAVLKLSAWGARLLHEHRYRATLKVNFLPDLTAAQIEGELKNCRSRHPKRHAVGECPFPLPKRYWTRIVQTAGATDETTWANLTKEALAGIITELSDASFAIGGKGIFKEEFVTCGGVSLKEVDFKTMQSRRCAGLYFAGELLDIDGVTGGFNFQNAWTTSWIAGGSMAK